MDKNIIYKWGHYYFKSDFQIYGLKSIKFIPDKKVTAFIRKYPYFSDPTLKPKTMKLISHKFHRYAVYNKGRNYYVAAKSASHDACDFITHHVLPMILCKNNELIAHGASVYKKNFAVIVIGKSGAGKSTLAASLLKDNWQLTGDESQVLRIKNKNWTCESLAPTMRLHKPRRCQKKDRPRIKSLKILKSNIKNQKTLKAIIILHKSKGTEFKIQRQYSDIGFKLLIENSFLHQDLNPKNRAAIFKKIHKLYSSTPVFLVTYPHTIKSKKAMHVFINHL